MEFGKLEDISTVDWSLPPDDPVSTRFLNAHRARQTSGGMKIYFGAPAWSHKEWVGKIYPPKTKSTEFLHHYARYFTCLEMNTVHYGIPKPERVEQWRTQVPPSFLFCPKVFKGISHSPSGLRDRGLLKPEGL